MTSKPPPGPQGSPPPSEAVPIRPRTTSASSSSKQNPHAPLNPSHLRESHVPSPSPEESMSIPRSPEDQHGEPSSSSRAHGPEIEEDGIHPTLPDNASVHSDNSEHQADTSFHVQAEPNLRSRLLSHQNWDQASGCGSENCDHGTMSPRPGTRRSYGSFGSNDGPEDQYPASLAEVLGNSSDASQSLLTDAGGNGRNGDRPGNKRTRTRDLARRHGIKNQKMM
jgi:hypothetical protein